MRPAHLLRPPLPRAFPHAGASGRRAAAPARAVAAARGGIIGKRSQRRAPSKTSSFLAACNSCGTAGETVFGGASRILGPRGELLAAAGAGEGRSSPPRSIFPSLRRSATPSTSFTTVGRSYIASEIKRRPETAGSRAFSVLTKKFHKFCAFHRYLPMEMPLAARYPHACRRDRGAALLPLHFVISIPMKIKEL